MYKTGFIFTGRRGSLEDHGQTLVAGPADDRSKLGGLIFFKSTNDQKRAFLGVATRGLWHREIGGAEPVTTDDGQHILYTSEVPNASDILRGRVWRSLGQKVWLGLGDPSADGSRCIAPAMLFGGPHRAAAAAWERNDKRTTLPAFDRKGSCVVGQASATLDREEGAEPHTEYRTDTSRRLKRIDIRREGSVRKDGEVGGISSAEAGGCVEVCRWER